MKKVQRHGSSGECKLKPVSDDFTLTRWLELKGLSTKRNSQNCWQERKNGTTTSEKGLASPHKTQGTLTTRRSHLQGAPCSRMSTVRLFITVKNNPNAHQQQADKLWNMYTMEHYSVMKKIQPQGLTSHVKC